MNIPSRRDAMNFTKPYVAEPFVIATTTDKFFIKDEKDLSYKKMVLLKAMPTSKYSNRKILLLRSLK